MSHVLLPGGMAHFVGLERCRVTAGQSVGTTFRITSVLINSAKSIIKYFPFPGSQTHVSRQVLSSCQQFLVWVLCFLSMQLSIGLPVRLNNIILC